MGYKEAFSSDLNWTGVDTNIKLNDKKAKKFIDFLHDEEVELVIRYYASSERSKTTDKAEVKFLCSEGFSFLPVYQDRARSTADFGYANGKKSAEHALWFADLVGQPQKSTIMFAVDFDLRQADINTHIVPFFEGVKENVDGKFQVGAYGSGACMRTLIDRDLIEVPWLSMSRGFVGTQAFFESDEWALRQVPPDITFSPGISYDKNVLNWSVDDIGAFKI